MVGRTVIAFLIENLSKYFSVIENGNRKSIYYCKVGMLEIICAKIKNWFFNFLLGIFSFFSDSQFTSFSIITYADVDVSLFKENDI